MKIPVAAGRDGGHADLALVWASLVASLAFGPLGAVAAIVFGWVAVHESAEDDEPSRRTSVMALLAVALGVLMTVCWGAAIALGVWSGGRREVSLGGGDVGARGGALRGARRALGAAALAPRSRGRSRRGCADPEGDDGARGGRGDGRRRGRGRDVARRRAREATRGGGASRRDGARDDDARGVFVMPE